MVSRRTLIAPLMAGLLTLFTVVACDGNAIPTPAPTPPRPVPTATANSTRDPTNTPAVLTPTPATVTPAPTTAPQPTVTQEMVIATPTVATPPKLFELVCDFIYFLLG